MSEKAILVGQRVELPPIREVHRYFEDSISANYVLAQNCIRYRDATLKYEYVNKRANGLARGLLHKIGCLAETSVSNRPNVIGVDIEPGPELIITLMAILKTGAAYLPLDPLLPSDRMKHIIHDAKPIAIVVLRKETHLLHNNAELCPETIVFNLAELEECIIDNNMSDDNISDREMVPRDINDPIASVIYTSGSTGVPKGVLIRHKSVINRLYWQWGVFPWEADEVACFKTSILFVDSMIEVFGTILALVPLVIAPKEIAVNMEKVVDLLEENEVTRLTFVPSFLRNVLSFASLQESNRGRLPNLRLWISNSETLPIRLLSEFFDKFPNRRFANFYGSTESMADVAYEEFLSHDDIELKQKDSRLSIGIPIYNSNIYILGANLELLEEGEIGEICISGLNIASGYMDQDKNVMFISNPYHSDNDPNMVRLYRSGDYGMISDGRIYYDGRRDMQVKIRGHRINTSEIERVVSSVKNVTRAVVLCHNVSESNVAIVCYYTTKNGFNVDKKVVEEVCKRSFPPYMMPKLVPLNNIPLQRQTSKVDRVALRRVFDEIRMRASQLSYELQDLDEMSLNIVKIVAQVLTLPETSVSLSASFLDLGGNSVSAIEAIVQLRSGGYHISIDEFVNANSIREMISKCEPLECATPELSIEDKYELVSMKEAGEDAGKQFIEILTKGFCTKEPLDYILGITPDEFNVFAQSTYKIALETPSFIVRRKDDGRIVGGEVVCDFFNEPPIDIHTKMGPITEILEKLEIEQKRRLQVAGQGPLMLSFVLCVDVSLNQSEQLQLVNFIIGAGIDIAKKHGYKGLLAENTNPVTQNICQYYYGYQILENVHVKSFITKNGNKPFSNAPDDYYLKLMIKYV